MSKYVPDIMSRRWVIIASQRLGRPDEHVKVPKKKDVCIFCQGNEALTGPEALRFGKGEANKPGWSVRVIANKYPITDFHEVIIHSPDCDHDVFCLPLSQAELVFKAYRQRFNYYRQAGQVLIFGNHGEAAGASIEHPHSQLVVIPFQINLDTVVREPLNNIVDENTFFHIYCPDFSQWPYEVWIAPKVENTYFGDITDEQITDLADLYQKILKQLQKVHAKSHLTLHEFSYNFYIYPKQNWYMRIIPRFVHRAGFELGTGLSVNVVDPADAALELRDGDGKMQQVMEKIKKLKT